MNHEKKVYNEWSYAKKAVEETLSKYLQKSADTAHQQLKDETPTQGQDTTRTYQQQRTPKIARTL